MCKVDDKTVNDRDLIGLLTIQAYAILRKHKAEKESARKFWESVADTAARTIRQRVLGVA
jgi:hypothetical protein